MLTFVCSGIDGRIPNTNAYVTNPLGPIVSLIDLFQFNKSKYIAMFLLNTIFYFAMLFGNQNSVAEC